MTEHRPMDLLKEYGDSLGVTALATLLALMTSSSRTIAGVVGQDMELASRVAVLAATCIGIAVTVARFAWDAIDRYERRRAMKGPRPRQDTPMGKGR